MGHPSVMETPTEMAALDLASSSNTPLASLDNVDFAIKSFLRPQALWRLLESISAYYPQAPITVVDDGDIQSSRDTDSEACCAWIEADSRTTLESLPFGLGVSAGRNQLVDRTTRPYILFLDDDFCFADGTARGAVCGAA